MLRCSQWRHDLDLKYFYYLAKFLFESKRFSHGCGHKSFSTPGFSDESLFSLMCLLQGGCRGMLWLPLLINLISVHDLLAHARLVVPIVVVSLLIGAKLMIIAIFDEVVEVILDQI